MIHGIIPSIPSSHIVTIYSHIASHQYCHMLGKQSKKSSQSKRSLKAKANHHTGAWVHWHYQSCQVCVGACHTYATAKSVCFILEDLSEELQGVWTNLQGMRIPDMQEQKRKRKRKTGCQKEMAGCSAMPFYPSWNNAVECQMHNKQGLALSLVAVAVSDNSDCFLFLFSFHPLVHICLGCAGSPLSG